MPVKKRKLADLSTEEFLATGLDSDYDEEKSNPKKEKAKKAKTHKSESSSKIDKKKKAVDHKQSLNALKEKDPEFYKFLQEEDKSLLDFDPGDFSDDPDEPGDEGAAGSDSDPARSEGDAEHDSSDLDSDVGSSDDEQQVHTLPDSLEVASDSESDYDESAAADKSSKGGVRVTHKLIAQWALKLKEKDSMMAVHQAVSAFKAAVYSNSEGGQDPAVRKYKVSGSAVFNAIVSMCMTEMYPALLRILELSKEKPSNGKRVLNLDKKPKWKKMKLDVKSYLTDLLHLAGYMAEPSILNVLLKHIYQLTNFYAQFPKLVKSVVKTLVHIWSSGEDTSRVLAFLSINSLTRKLQDTLLEYVLKQMYLAYVKNCKFTSPSTLPMISFMQRSLVELFAIDTAVTYQYAFVYIRQLAIHLRNAITNKTKELMHAVYNWQYVHSLQLWARLISQLWPNETLAPLIYPLVQVLLGSVKLIPSPNFYPLRFHCVKALNMIAESTGTFIPVLPLLIEVLDMTNFERRPKKSSIKPYNFACILKFSKGEVSDKAFLDGVMDNLYDHLIETFAIQSHTIGFPEIALPALLRLKAFVKKEKLNNNHRKLMRQVLEKVQQTSHVISVRRKKSALSLADSVAVDAWERRSKDDGTPLTKYFAQYKKKRDIELQKEIIDRDRDLIKSEDLPVIERKKREQKASEQEREEFKGLFASDTSDSEAAASESDDEERFKLKEERKPKSSKAKKQEESSDEYSDLDDEEMTMLDGSASESAEDEEDAEEEDLEGEVESENEDDSSASVNEEENGSDEGDIVQDFVFSDEDESE